MLFTLVSMPPIDSYAHSPFLCAISLPSCLSLVVWRWRLRIRPRRARFRKVASWAELALTEGRRHCTTNTTHTTQLSVTTEFLILRTSGGVLASSAHAHASTRRCSRQSLQLLS